MAGLDRNNLPSRVIAYWNIEDKADNNNVFASVGSKAGVPLSNFVIGENSRGMNDHIPAEPLYSSGTPFIDGTGYNVVTTPTWIVRNLAKVTNAEGDDKSGSAEVSFSKGGDYAVQLSLDNSYGSHTASYPVFNITGKEGGISDIVGNDKMNVYTVDGILFVEFASEGEYTVSVHDISGRLAGRSTRRVLAGDNMSISLSKGGIYVVSVEKDNQNMRTIKVLNK